LNTSLPGALAGVRVLDFTRVLAGPFCTMQLADLGADVIKVEDPQRGDETRQWGPPWHGEHSAYFLSVNRNKRSITLNLKSLEGQEIARRLAAQSHIVVENFRPGQMARFGLGYTDLAALNPALVYGSITGYGQTGPYADRPGYDFVIQGMSGLMSITGPEDAEPYKVGVAVSDVFAGLFAATSLLAALRHAEQTGVGQHVDIALLDTQIAALVNVASTALTTGRAPGRYGNAHANIVPYQAFEAADRPFTVAVGNDRQFGQLCALIGREELRDDPRYSTNPARVANRETLIPQLAAAFAARPAAFWVEALLALGIPAGEINTVDAALRDPHVQARGLVVDIDGVPLVGAPAQFSQTPPQMRTPPPALGEHTETVLAELLGLDSAMIAGYRAGGVI
jgi:crotonobetainyl-CoA:carnitine CoA-transferase CaiB-like acyl-CoA transferase